MPDTPDPALVFAVFTEIGIINQLSTTILESVLPPGMVAAQWGVLNHLSRRPQGRTPAQIADAFQVPRTSMTHSVAVLERLGYVETAANPADGRSKIVRATPAGLAFQGRVMAALAPEMARILAPLDPAIMAALLPGLTALRTVLDTARDAPDEAAGRAVP
jgi:DNA-binding MarR family transcriptional regulator